MFGQSVKYKLVCKLGFTVTFLVGLVTLPMRQLVPNLAPGTLVFYCASGIALLLIVIVICTILSLQFSQFILRHGGTDAQWFWFSSEPKGLVELRRQQAVLKAERDKS